MEYPYIFCKTWVFYSYNEGAYHLISACHLTNLPLKVHALARRQHLIMDIVYTTVWLVDYNTTLLLQFLLSQVRRQSILSYSFTHNQLLKQLKTANSTHANTSNLYKIIIIKSPFIFCCLLCRHNSIFISWRWKSSKFSQVAWSSNIRDASTTLEKHLTNALEDSVKIA